MVFAHHHHFHPIILNFRKASSAPTASAQSFGKHELQRRPEVLSAYQVQKEVDPEAGIEQDVGPGLNIVEKLVPVGGSPEFLKFGVA